MPPLTISHLTAATVPPTLVTRPPTAVVTGLLAAAIVAEIADCGAHLICKTSDRSAETERRRPLSDMVTALVT